MRNITYIIILYIFTGCCTLKKVTKKNVIQKDSIVYNFIEKDSIIFEVRTEVIPASKTDLILKDVCDSLGNIKVAELRAQLGKTNIRLTTNNNTIYLEANTDSIVSVYKSKYESKFKQDSLSIVNFYKEKLTSKEVKTKTPKWAWLLLSSFIGDVV